MGNNTHSRKGKGSKYVTSTLSWKELKHEFILDHNKTQMCTLISRVTIQNHDKILTRKLIETKGMIKYNY